MKITITYNEEPDVQLEQQMNNLLEYEGFSMSNYILVDTSQDGEIEVEIEYQR